MKARPSTITALLMSLVLMVAVVPGGGRSTVARSPQMSQSVSVVGTQAAPQPVQVFRDDFTGTSIDTNVWQVYDNSGTISVDSGFVAVSSPSTAGAFPYIHAKNNLIPPTGNFSIKVGVQYTALTGYGTGFGVDETLTPNGTMGTGQLGFSFWNGSGQPGFILVNYASDIVYQVPDPNLAKHDIEFRWLDTTDEFYVDGVLVNTVPRSATAARPTVIRFGNSVVPGQGAWTSFKLDYIEVDALLSSGCIQPPGGLISWWPGDGNTSDMVGGNPGTLQNGATFTTGKVGQAFSLDGIDDYVSMGNPANLKLAGDITLSAWINPSTAPPLNSFSQLYSIITKWGQGVSSDAYGLWLQNTDNNIGLIGAIGDGSIPDAFPQNGGAIPIGTWTHVAMTYDHITGVNRLYVNGIQVAERVRPGGINSSDDYVLIGAEDMRQSGWPRYFQGAIDDAQIYDHALTGTEIQTIFTSGSAGLCETFSISGHVADASSNPISGVAISTSPTISTTTDTNGDYTITNLISGTYTLTPSLSGYTFSPTSIVVNVPPEATEQDFIAILIPTTTPTDKPTNTSTTTPTNTPTSTSTATSTPTSTTSQECRLANFGDANSVLLKQTDSNWAKLPYGGYVDASTNKFYPFIWDGIGKDNIGRWGCTMTSAAMIVNYFAKKQGVSFQTDPQRLNEWLQRNDGYQHEITLKLDPEKIKIWAQHSDNKNYVLTQIVGDKYVTQAFVKYNKIADYAKEMTKDLSNGPVLISPGNVNAGRNDQLVNATICMDKPVILNVQKPGYDHYVVASGATSRLAFDTLYLHDPLESSVITLRQKWGNTYYRYQIYEGAKLNPGLSVGVSVSGNAISQLASTSNINVSLLIIDPQGRRTGYNTSTGETFTEIPNSSYGEETLTTSDSSTTLRHNLFNVMEPLSGTYIVQVIGSGQYGLAIDGTDQEGNITTLQLSGNVSLGKLIRYQIAYSPLTDSPIRVIGQSSTIYLPLVVR